MNLPKIEHAEVTLTEKNCVVIKMEEGWRFWNKADYRDENGEIREPELEEIVYGRLGIYSLSTDFSLFVVIAESDIPEIPVEPKEPIEPIEPEIPVEPETQATETDYINALEELGVNFNE